MRLARPGADDEAVRDALDDADRPVVVFDEPTEHLDEPAAAALAADLLEATRGRTVLVVSHRPELFATIARGLLLRDGQLVELRRTSAAR